MPHLLLGDLHVVGDVRKHCRLNEVALAAMTITTSGNMSTVALARLNVTHDAFELNLIHLRALHGTFLVPGSHLNLSSTFH